MLIRKEEDLDAIKTEIFDAAIGFDAERSLAAQRTQSQRLLTARRAIEQRREEAEISPYLDQNCWFEE